MKPNPTLTRMIGTSRRRLRGRKRGLLGGSFRQRCLVALKGLTEMESDPTRPGLAVAVAMAVRRATA